MNDAESPSRVRHYKELIVWQRAMQLVKSVYRLTKTFPPDERYGLALQMRRAAVSVPSNIAEGQGRRGPKEFTHFLSLTRGSLLELETQLLLSIDLGYVKRADAAGAQGEIVEVQKMAAAIQKRLAGRIEGVEEQED
jgi:four helix bundle protein